MPARVVLRLADVDRGHRAAGPRRRADDRAHRRRRRRDGVHRRRRAVRDRAASGGQPGVRSRRQPVCDLQRHARPAGAGVDLPRAAQRHARDVFVGHRQPDVDGARSEGRLYVSSRFEGTVYRVARGRLGRAVRQRSRRRVRARVRAGRDAVCRRSIGDDLSRRSRTGTREGVRVAAVERRGVSPGVRPRRRALRHRADAVDLRLGVPGRCGRHRDDPRTPGSAGRKGSHSTRRARCSSSRRSRA